MAKTAIISNTKCQTEKTDSNDVLFQSNNSFIIRHKRLKSWWYHACLSLLCLGLCRSV